MFMKGHLQWALLLLACAVMAGCGGDDKDDDGNPAGPEGPGAPITADNVSQVQTALTSTLGAVAAKGPGTHAGAVHGTVTVAVGTGRRAQAGTVSLSMAFDDYSDDGELFIDGELNYSAGTTTSITGDIELSGTYDGEVELDLTVTGLQVTGSLTVNGAAIGLTTGALTTGVPGIDDGEASDDGTDDISDLAICTPDEGGQCLDLRVGSEDAIDATPFSVGIGGDAVSILGARFTILFLPVGEGTFQCGEGMLLLRDGSLNSAGALQGSCTVQVVEFGLRIRGTFSANTRNALGTQDGPVLTGSFDLKNPAPPSSIMRATVNGVAQEAEQPVVLNVSTVLSVSMPLPEYGPTTRLVVNLNANNVVTGTFDCADRLTGTSIAISPAPVLTSTTATAPSCRIEVTDLSDGFVNGTFSATLGNGTDPDVAVTDGSFRFASP